MTLKGFFDIESRGTTVRTEAAAGITTFRTMCYIIFVNPGIGLGFILFTLIKLVRGRIKEVHPLMIAVAAAFVAFYVLETF